MNTKSASPEASNPLFIWGSFFVLTLFWGSSFILVKKGLIALAPMELASIRLTAAMLVMIGFALRNFRFIPREKLPYVALSGLLSMFFPAYLFCEAQVGLNSSIVGVLNAMTPAFTFIAGILFFRQKAKWLQAIGLFLGFIGCALLILVNAKGDLSLNGYSFFVILATLCYGLNTNMVKRHLQDVNPIHLTTVAVSFSGLLALIHLSTCNWVETVQHTP